MSGNNEMAITTRRLDVPAAQEPATFNLSDMQLMAKACAASGLFACKTPDQALMLMLIAQSEGLHPVKAVRMYDIIQGRPSMKAEAILATFQSRGGKVRWIVRTDTEASAEFTASNGTAATVNWNIQRSITAGLGGNAMWKKYPRQMLSARVVSEGVRATDPGAMLGLPASEEAMDFDDAPAPTPSRQPFIDQAAKFRDDVAEITAEQKWTREETDASIDAVLARLGKPLDEQLRQMGWGEKFIRSVRDGKLKRAVIAAKADEKVGVADTEAPAMDFNTFREVADSRCPDTVDGDDFNALMDKLRKAPAQLPAIAEAMQAGGFDWAKGEVLK